MQALPTNRDVVRIQHAVATEPHSTREPKLLRNARMWRKAFVHNHIQFHELVSCNCERPLQNKAIVKKARSPKWVDGLEQLGI